MAEVIGKIIVKNDIQRTLINFFTFIHVNCNYNYLVFLLILLVGIVVTKWIPIE